MSIGILLITHNNIGAALLDTALINLGRENPGVQTIQVGFDADPDKILVQCRHIVKEIDRGHGVLVLTDLYGSTPSNIANKLTDINNTHVIAGINLPMVMKVINYAEESIDSLIERTLKGGKNGILATYANEHQKQRNAW